MNAIRHLPLHTSVASLRTPPSAVPKLSLAAVVVCVAVIIDAAAIVMLLGFAIGVIAANL